jgi:hypothetical protein
MQGVILMREYTIRRVAGTPDFASIPALDINTRLWCQEVAITAQAQICYSEEGLHVRLSAQEENIRAEENGPLGVPCVDSCLEFFFCPMEGDDRYLSIECNPNGCLYLGFCNTNRRIIRLLPDEVKASEPVIARVDGGWNVTYTVPTTYVRLFFPEFRLESGKILRANCFKCVDLTVQEHYFSWNPIDLVDPDFHRPDFFGKMILE